MKNYKNEDENSTVLRRKNKSKKSRIIGSSGEKDCSQQVSKGARIIRIDFTGIKKPKMASASEIAEALGGTWNGGSCNVRCPAHNDHNPSLTISEGMDGTALLYCHAGCAQEEVISAIVSRYSLRPTRAVSNKVIVHPELGVPAYIYSYRNSKAEVILQVCRFLISGNKTYRPFIPSENRWHFPSLRPLYNLDFLYKKSWAPVLIVEGEKTVEAAQKYFPEYVVTTWPGGAKANFNNVDFTPLKGRQVVIFPDNDNVGIDAAQKLQSKIGGQIYLPPKATVEGWDLADPLPAGVSLEEIKNGLEDLFRSPTASPRAIVSLNIQELLKLELPPRENILAPWLPTQGLAMLYAIRGIGKTHVALGIGHAVATGGTFLKWKAPKPRRVLYLDGEMSLIAMQERIAKIVKDGEMPVADYFRLVSPDQQEYGLQLGTAEGQERLEPLLGDTDLVIVDNLSTLASFGRENEAESWLPIQQWALKLRRRGISVLFIHHAGKAGTQRGTSRREDVLDTVISLKPPKDYEPSAGAHFEVHFEKSRGVFGDEVLPVDVKLTPNGWEYQLIDDSRREEILALHAEGFSQREIAKRVGASASSINRELKKKK